MSVQAEAVLSPRFLDRLPGYKRCDESKLGPGVCRRVLCGSRGAEGNSSSKR